MSSSVLTDRRPGESATDYIERRMTERLEEARRRRTGTTTVAGRDSTSSLPSVPVVLPASSFSAPQVLQAVPATSLPSPVILATTAAAFGTCEEESAHLDDWTRRRLELTGEGKLSTDRRTTSSPPSHVSPMLNRLLKDNEEMSVLQHRNNYNTSDASILTHHAAGSVGASKTAATPIVVSGESLRDVCGGTSRVGSSDHHYDDIRTPPSLKRLGDKNFPLLSSPPMVHSAMWFHPREHHRVNVHQTSSVVATTTSTSQKKTTSPPPHAYHRGSSYATSPQRRQGEDDSSRNHHVPPTAHQHRANDHGSSSINNKTYPQPVRRAPLLAASSGAGHASIGDTNDEELVQDVLERQRQYNRRSLSAADDEGTMRHNYLSSTSSSSFAVVPSAIVAAEGYDSGTAPRYHQHHHHEATMTSFWITVWPSFYRAGVPQRICVAPKTMYMQAVLERAAAAIRCEPAPTVLFTPCGKAVRELEDLQAEGHYIIAPGAVRYDERMVPTALLQHLVRAAKRAASFC